jgi:hypothetical protein
MSKSRVYRDKSSHSGWEAFKWTSLRTILDNKVVASTSVWIFLLPIMISFTQAFPNHLNIFPFNSRDPLRLSLQLPYNWYLLYFSALFFALARFIYILFCPSFLRQYGTAAKANAAGMTTEVIKDSATQYLLRFQGRTVHPLSDEGMAIDTLFKEVFGPGLYVENKFDGKNTDHFSDRFLNATLVEDSSGGLYRVTSNKSFTRHDPQPDKSKNLLIWRFLELQEISTPFVRVISTMLAIAGAVLLLIPATQGFLSVLDGFLSYQ